MLQIVFIIVNDSAINCRNRKYSQSYIPYIGYCIFVCCPDIPYLCHLRDKHPEAKIMGQSEIDFSASHAPIKVNPSTNALRRVMSEM
jgi:hypothetical protein